MPPNTASTHLSPAELSYLHTSLSSHPPIRPDARLAIDFRPLNAETGVLPNTMGSAHVGFADGREAVVGIRAEVERTSYKGMTRRDNRDQDTEMKESGLTSFEGKGRAEWITLSLTLPGFRDDDKDLVFLEETLREVLTISAQSSSSTVDKRSVASLQDALIINRRWHWHLYIDVLLISPPATSSSPLPLLSIAIHVALRDTRIPRLKSEGEEDPIADDDWEASICLYHRPPTSTRSTSVATSQSLITPGVTPPVTLLVMSVGENILFDPSATELSVADGIWAVSVSQTMKASTTAKDGNNAVKILGMRMLETPARNTMKGVPRDTEQQGQVGLGGLAATAHDKDSPTQSATPYNLGSGTDQDIAGVWKPKVGGVKRSVISKVLKAVGGDGGVGADTLSSLEGFVTKSI